MVRDKSGSISIVDEHVVALRFLPDYLRHADRFQMLGLVEPRNAWHPNIAPRDHDHAGAICVEIYPGESVVEIAESLHDLIRWRLRQYDERDALNAAACAYGRTHVDKPIDDRPLFGRRVHVELKPVEDA
jgi:hypothetical protein